MSAAAGDPYLLATAIRGASEVIVRRGGVVRGEPATTEVALRVVAPAEVQMLTSAMQVDHVTDALCMCSGDPSLEFLERGRRLALVGLHHARRVRWEQGGWAGDAHLTDGAELVRQLAEFGFPDTLTALDRADSRRALLARQEAHWAAAVPGSVRGVVSRMLATSNGAGVPADLIDDVEQRVSNDVVDERERCIVLLRWYGAGSGRASGFPVHEGIPGQLLSRLPIEVVLTAMDDLGHDDEAWAGAVRHLAGWRSRTDDDLAMVGDARWRELTNWAALHSDADTARRLEVTRSRAQEENSRRR